MPASDITQMNRELFLGYADTHGTWTPSRLMAGTGIRTKWEYHTTARNLRRDGVPIVCAPRGPREEWQWGLASGYREPMAWAWRDKCVRYCKSHMGTVIAVVAQLPDGKERRGLLSDLDSALWRLEDMVSGVTR